MSSFTTNALPNAVKAMWPALSLATHLRVKAAAFEIIRFARTIVLAADRARLAARTATALTAKLILALSMTAAGQTQSVLLLTTSHNVSVGKSLVF